MKVRTQQANITSIKPYLDHFSSMHLKAYFTNNDMVTPIHINTQTDVFYSVLENKPPGTYKIEGLAYMLSLRSLIF